MVDTNFINKLGLIIDFIKDNLLIGLIIILILAIILDLFYGNNKKEIKVMYGIIIFLLLLFIGFIYYKSVFNIFDVYITNMIKITYFPSIIDYISIILITIVVQIFSLKKKNGFVKHFNFWIAIVIEILFVLNVVALNGINIDLSNVTSIYENNLLLSLFQVTGIIFMLWIIINILSFIVSLYLEDKIEMPKLNKDIY